MAASTTTPTRFDVNYFGGFSNLSTSSSSLLHPTFGTTTAASAINLYQVEQLTILWILFVSIVVGNAAVLIALLLSKGHKSRMNFFIKHLAAADLCVGLFSVLTETIWRITISWHAGHVACKIIRFLQCVVTYSSTYVLVALSIDRYDAITHPMNFSGSWRRARILVGTAWILSAVFASPIIYVFNTKEVPVYGVQCYIDFDRQWKWQVYMTLVAVTLFFIPAILISACYIIIVCTIWKKGKAMQTTAANSSANRAEPANDDAEQESRRASSRGLIPKAKVKTVKMTFVIIFVFILCWSPYMIMDLLQVFEVFNNKTVASFIQNLAHLNSAANPLIYCLFSTNIGSTLCNILCCRRKTEPLPTGLTTSTHSSSQSRPIMATAAPAAAAGNKGCTVTSIKTRRCLDDGDGLVTFSTAASIEN